MDKREFGLRLRFIRKNLKMTKNDFSEKIDLSASFLNEIECGAKGVSIETIERICEFAGVSSDYLIFGKENLPNHKTPIIEMLESIPEKYNMVVLDFLKDLTSLINKVENMNTDNS